MPHSHSRLGQSSTGLRHFAACLRLPQLCCTQLLLQLQLLGLEALLQQAGTDEPLCVYCGMQTRSMQWQKTLCAMQPSGSPESCAASTNLAWCHPTVCDGFLSRPTS